MTQVYGLTEVYGPHSICEWQTKWDSLPIEERAKIKARQGVPYVHAQHMDVWDPVSMVPVPRDGKTIGEIVMRGNNVMLGYYKDPDATADAFAGGWFHSGDLAAVHPDNYVQIMDRKKDIIISGGENISTVEVESIIYLHPDVLEVAVIAIPDEKWGEVPREGLRGAQAGDQSYGKGYYRTLQKEPCPFQGPEGSGIRQSPNHNRQGQENSSCAKKNGQAVSVK